MHYLELTIPIVLITIVSVILSLWLNKKYNNVFDKYWLRIVIGIFFLTYFIILRFSQNWKFLLEALNNNAMIPEWFKDKYPEDTITMFRSYTLSKSLFMDLCPFFSIALCVSMILDKTKRWAFLVSPFCILGGLIVMPLIATIEKDQYFTPKWVFVGTNENRLYFLMHWFLIVFGSLAFVNFKNIVYKKDLLAIHIIALIFFAYVIFNAYVLNIDQNVTGVKIKDWYEGDYKGVRKLLNGKWHLPLWLTITLTYMTAYGFVVGLFSARYYFVKNKILAKEQPLKLQYS